jgi:signal transduction histidine kinase
LLLIERLVTPDETHRPVLVQLATDDDALRQARSEFGWEMLGSLTLLWLVLLLAAYAQVVLGLKPLARIRDEVDRLRRNPGARLSPEQLAEVRPLIDAINALAEARGADLMRARSRAADLAHSLKTPLSALAAQSRRAREQGATDAADGLDRAIAAAAAAIEAELARARSAAARNEASQAEAKVLDTVEGILAVLERTEAGETMAFDIAIEPELRVPVAASDLAEILGALMENATRHARRSVRVTGTAAADRIVLSVSDDGPGIDAGRTEMAVARGGRLDETGPGHGFGLSIVKDLIEATGGELRLQRGDMGGLEALMSWPDGAAAFD